MKIVPVIGNGPYPGELLHVEPDDQKGIAFVRNGNGEFQVSLVVGSTIEDGRQTMFAGLIPSLSEHPTLACHQRELTRGLLLQWLTPYNYEVPNVVLGDEIQDHGVIVVINGNPCATQLTEYSVN